MANLLALSAAAVFTLPSQPILARQVLMTKSATIVVHVHASADAAFPLFDPINEMKWDPDWKPQLLGDRVAEGLVFLVNDNGDKSTWLIDRYDPVTRTIAYVALRGSTLTRIRIDVSPDGDQSLARVAYTRTALDDAGVKAVEHFAAHFPSQGPHWESAINGYLASVGVPR